MLLLRTVKINISLSDHIRCATVAHFEDILYKSELVLLVSVLLLRFK